jgi:hypothetical protein
LGSKLRQLFDTDGSMECSMIWRESATPAGGRTPGLFRQRPHRRDRLWLVANASGEMQRTSTRTAHSPRNCGGNPHHWRLSHSRAKCHGGWFRVFTAWRWGTH